MLGLLSVKTIEKVHVKLITLQACCLHLLKKPCRGEAGRGAAACAAYPLCKDCRRSAPTPRCVWRTSVPCCIAQEALVPLQRGV